MAGDKPNILEEANATITERAAAYGPPNKNLVDVAAVWGQYLGTHLHPRDVCVLMILMKACRDKPRDGSSRSRDNLVDIAGYARCAEMVWGDE